MATAPEPTPTLTQALLSGDHWLMLGLGLSLAGLAIVLHYEALERLNRALPRLRMAHRSRLLVLMFGLLLVHTLEIWLFGTSLFMVSRYPQFGRVAGIEPLQLLDAVYLSTATYSTVGYGDLTPQGPLRLLLGIEALCGFLLVTWSASFTYLEMQRNWRLH